MMFCLFELHNIIPKSLIDAFYRNDIYILKPNQKRSFQVEVSNKDSFSKYYNAVSSPIQIPGEDEVYLITVLSDITSCIEASKAIEKEYLRNDFLGKAKPEFVSGLSHEVRTPLNAIMGFAEILLLKEENPTLKNYVEIIKESGGKILELIDNIVDYTLLESDNLNIFYNGFNVKEAFDSVIEPFIQKIESKGINLLVNISDNMPERIILDENRFKQILMNIVSNAVKFTKAGFIKIDLIASNSNNYKELIDLKIVIEDSGIGIKEELLNGVFNVFNIHSGSNIKKYEGTGLGLAITKQLVEKLKGKISITGKAGTGTKAEVVFPLIGFEGQPEEPISPEIENIQITKIKNSIVLVADDVEHNRDLIKEFLANMNIGLLESESGEETLEIIKQIKPDVILLDLIMPDIDGIETARRIKQEANLADIPLIAFTASNSNETLVNLDIDLFSGYLQKPVNKNALLDELKKFLPITSFLKDIPLNLVKPEIDFNRQHSGDISLAVPLILNMLETEVKSKCQKAEKALSQEKIEMFIQDLEMIHKKYNIDFISKYCKNLRNQIASNNNDRVSSLLSEYPDLIERVKSLK